MNFKEISFINKALIGFLGLGLVINIIRGAYGVYRAINDYISFDYKLAIREHDTAKVNMVDAYLSIDAITLTSTFIISCFIAYLFFSGKKLFIPLFILSCIYSTLLEFILNVLRNLVEYEGFKETLIPLVVTIFWAIYLIFSKEMKLMFTNEMTFKKRYVKISVEEYETLKNTNE